MCSGAIFWAGIPTVVYALSEEALYGMLRPESRDLVLALPSREVFARGGTPTTVIGPVDLPEAATVHDGFWS
jgi:tRNA(Arg) A34 adenosine deaminase TadA